MVTALVLSGCQDTIVKAIGPENDPSLTVQADYFRFYADDMDNVYDEFTTEFTFSDTVAAVIHRNFVHHGSGRLIITDAIGDTVYNSGLEWNLDLESRPAHPGRWKAYLGLFGARGRVDVRVQKLGTPIEP
jgi:hypothetical protein